MEQGLKIATIGGGSSYTPELVEGLINRHDELPVRELWLVDIEAGREKLEIVGALAQRMVARAGNPFKVVLTLDREEALKGADFVTTQFRVGLLDARAKDERIPLEHHVIGQETNGPGGLFKGLRTIPVILEGLSRKFLSARPFVPEPAAADFIQRDSSRGIDRLQEPQVAAQQHRRIIRQGIHRPKFFTKIKIASARIRRKLRFISFFSSGVRSSLYQSSGFSPPIQEPIAYSISYSVQTSLRSSVPNSS